MPKVTDPRLLNQLNGQQQGVQIAPADPLMPYKVQEAQGSAAAAPYEAQKAAADATVARATAPYAGAKAAADARAAEAQAKLAEAKVKEAQQTDANPLKDALHNDEILQTIADARQVINGSDFATGATSRLKVVGGNSATDLDALLTTLKGNLTIDNLKALKSQSATGASGFGALSEREGELIASTVASLNQAQSKQQLLNSLAKIERHYRSYSALLNNEDPRKPDVARKYGLIPAQEEKSIAGGGFKTVTDPTLRGVNDQLRTMVRDGRKPGEIVGYLNSVSPGLGNELSGKIAAATTFRTQHPEVPISRYTISVEDKQIPMSFQERNRNALGASAPGAFAMQAANALSGNNLDSLTPNPALTRATLEGSAQSSPTASPLGALLGFGLGAGASEGGAAALGAGKLAPALGDLGFGALAGAGGADNGDRATGALYGAGEGLLGGFAGRKVAGVLGGALRGVQSPDVRALRAQGVRMTPGQLLGQEGSFGRFVKGAEDRLSGFNGIGNEIKAAQTRGLEDFNRAADAQALAPIGVTPPPSVGPEASQFAHQATGNAYNILNDVAVPLDQQFAADLGGAAAKGRAIPGFEGKFDYLFNTRVAPYVDRPGIVTGKNFQAIQQGLRKGVQEMKNEPLGHDFGQSLGDVEGAFSDLVGRNRPDVIEGLRNANTAYRNVSVLDDARLRALNNGEVFTPAQLGMSMRQNTVKFGGKRAAAEGDMPFFDLQQSGQRVLPNKVPDSGTPGREAKFYSKIPQNLLLKPLYKEGPLNILQSILADRPDVAARLGVQIEKRAPAIGGMFGVPLSLNYYGN